MKENIGILILTMRDGPCDLGEPHVDTAAGKSVIARRVLAKIRAAGGHEMHLCQPCSRAWVAEERRADSFADDAA